MLENLSMLLFTQEADTAESVGISEHILRPLTAGDGDAFFHEIAGVAPGILGVLVVISVLSACFYYFVMKPNFKKMGLWFLMMLINAVLCFLLNGLIIHFGAESKYDGFYPQMIGFLFTTPLFYSVLVYFITSIIVKRKSPSNYNVPW